MTFHNTEDTPRLEQIRLSDLITVGLIAGWAANPAICHSGNASFFFEHDLEEVPLTAYKLGIEWAREMSAFEQSEDFERSL
jgi:hypothetical protein